MKTNQEFKREALDALRGNWGKAFLATLIFALIAALIQGPSSVYGMRQQDSLQSLITYGDTAGLLSLYGNLLRISGASFLAMLLIYNPLAVGYQNAFRLLLSGNNDLPHNMFSLALKNYWHKVLGMLWVSILISLWALLLVVPGIIKAFSYAMTPYILEENPELSASEAIHRSRFMMRGHKFDLFWLYLGFLGWFLLCLLTAGIGFLWLAPYMEAAQAAFYQDVKADYELHGGLN